MQLEKEVFALSVVLRLLPLLQFMISKQLHIDIHRSKHNAIIKGTTS